MTGEARSVLVTGADGYLGSMVVEGWLQETDLGVVATVRARDAVELSAKAQRVRRSLRAGDSGRVEVIAADLQSPDPFAAVTDNQARAISRIVHTAAVTRFNVALDLAEATNVAGSVAVGRLARRCPNIEAVGLCSTVYATGLRSGPVAEGDGDGGAGFANNYEWSKHAAEREAIRTAPDLPWRILRLATVICDDTDGEVSQHNAFHRTLRLCRHGLLPVLPGDPTVPLYLVSGRFCEDAIRRLLEPSVADGVYHLSHDRMHALTLGALLQRAFEAFESVDAFRRRHLLLPPFVDLAEFELVASTSFSSVTPILRQVLDSVRPFAPQLYVHKDLSCSRLDGIVPPPPSPRCLVDAALHHLVVTDWGNRAAA